MSTGALRLCEEFTTRQMPGVDGLTGVPNRRLVDSAGGDCQCWCGEHPGRCT